MSVFRETTFEVVAIVFDINIFQQLSFLPFLLAYALFLLKMNRFTDSKSISHAFLHN
jgi:hypothetical protein